jgi:hypothetical protein
MEKLATMAMIRGSRDIFVFSLLLSKENNAALASEMPTIYRQCVGNEKY